MEHFFLPKNGSVKRKADADIDTGKKPAKARKFDGTYLDLGFTSVVIRGETRPQCVVCGAILANESMKPAKLRRHLETKHGELIGKSRDFFARKLQVISQQKSTVQNIASTPASALKAFYDVAYLLAKNKKPFTDAEKVVLPAAIAMCRRMGAESVADKLKMIPLSDTTISRRVSEMADNITAQLITQLQTSLFALQLDEATDISREAHLIAYVRYCGATTILEDFLFCKAIKTRATASELFDILNDFMSSHCLRWEACVGICTDGAPSMCGDRSGLKAKVLAVAPHVVWTHCIIHREALAAQNMDNELSDVLSSAVKIFNAIKAQPTRARLFAILCAEMGSEHDGLLFHTEVRWLSRGRVLQRVFELRNEVRQFLLDVDTGKANHLCDPRCLVLLAYLADIFDKLNTLNMSLQGANANSFTMNKKVFAFKRKLDLWKQTIGAGVAVQFPLLAEAIEETECGKHLSIIIIKFIFKLKKTIYGDHQGARSMQDA
ncbi:zinc finger BED domain-containing protein 5-like [Ambystoma mexicanum]|uniref:zinc finger BED domain-containing protein 5-like n=1 Tax=Ambystoma mexicanum TaxID=8296 RepID=UPI0037E7442B